MDKKLVLQTFFGRNFPLKPDEVWNLCMGKYARTSVYAYLLRLKRQKLVERTNVGNRIAYRITIRGMKRLEYFRRKQK
jgi:hypothetical protein